MKIAALTLHGQAGWPELSWNTIGPGLNAVFGPKDSGKSTAAALVFHALYGTPPTTRLGAKGVVPEGDVIVEGAEGLYRLRRYSDGGGSRLTVAAMDGTGVDRETVRGLSYGLSPASWADFTA